MCTYHSHALPFVGLHTHAHTHQRQDQSSYPVLRLCSPPLETLLPQQALPGQPEPTAPKTLEQRQQYSVADSALPPTELASRPWWAHPYTLRVAHEMAHLFLWEAEAEAEAAGGSFPAFLAPDIEGVCEAQPPRDRPKEMGRGANSRVQAGAASGEGAQASLA